MLVFALTTGAWAEPASSVLIIAVAVPTATSTIQLFSLRRQEPKDSQLKA